jgi:ATP-dependent DNA helicase RecG
VVVPRIAGQEDQSSVNGARPAIALEDLAPQLIDGPLAQVRVGILHGQMSPADKEDVMRRFAQAREDADGIDVLIATTVIEVGVDVPNATMMVIMDAERFGISQLHQLRGRVGRGSAPGLCLLVSEAPPFTRARERLTAVASTNDGFELAALDLEQRHEGDVLGREQSGVRSSFKLVSIRDDEEILTLAHEVANLIVLGDPSLEQHQTLKSAIDAQFNHSRTEFVKKS